MTIKNGANKYSQINTGENPLDNSIKSTTKQSENNEKYSDVIELTEDKVEELLGLNLEAEKEVVKYNLLNNLSKYLGISYNNFKSPLPVIELLDQNDMLFIFTEIFFNTLKFNESNFKTEIFDELVTKNAKIIAVEAAIKVAHKIPKISLTNEYNFFIYKSYILLAQELGNKKIENKLLKIFNNSLKDLFEEPIFKNHHAKRNSKFFKDLAINLKDNGYESYKIILEEYEKYSESDKITTISELIIFKKKIGSINGIRELFEKLKYLIIDEKSKDKTSINLFKKNAELDKLMSDVIDELGM